MRLRLLAGVLCISSAIEAQPSSPAPPDATEKTRVLADATEYAINHEQSLPDFICRQTTRRFEDFDGHGWRLIDSIVERLTYFDHRENYKVVELNGQPVNVGHQQLRGWSSSGEFASVMKAIFLPQTQAEFAWQTWSTLRGRKMHVYEYQVAASRSRYHISVPERSLDLVTAYHGQIFIDSESHFVHRITLHPDGIPPSFPIQDVSLALDYDYTRIADTDYLLPLRFELRSREGNRPIKNDVEYDSYNKFSAVSVIVLTPPDESQK